MNPLTEVETNSNAASVISKNPAISFPVGYHELHPDISINFQLNRFYNWVGDDSMLTEMRNTVASVNDYPTFTKIILDLGEKALARHEVLKGAYYLRLAEFFLLFSDPRKLPTRQRFVDLLLEHSKLRRLPIAEFLLRPAGSLPIASRRPSRPSRRGRSSFSAGSTATLRNGCPQRWSFATHQRTITTDPCSVSSLTARRALFASSSGNTLTCGRIRRSRAIFRKSRASCRVILATLRI
jgi:hypothetical protein